MTPKHASLHYHSMRGSRGKKAVSCDNLAWFVTYTCTFQKWVSYSAFLRGLKWERRLSKGFFAVCRSAQELLMCEERGTVCYKHNGDSIF